jgi:CheY-like chemotaxis protein
MIKRVLIVDDSGISRKVMRKCLEFAGLSQAEFVEAEDGEKALAVLEHGQIDLLITDLNMPIMDGFELLRAIDESELGKHMIKIVTSSAASAAIDDEMKRHGVVAVFAKPVSPTAMAKVLAGRISERSQP